jgi:glycosyltransferase involved in cell wall biosynthesis
MGQKKVSLILTSFDREPDLLRFVDSINNQHEFLFSLVEIVFIDQGNNLDLIKKLDNRICLKYIKTSRVSLSKARNTGLLEAEGEIIGFPDDDCYYGSDFLNNLIELFDEKGDVICVNVYDPITERVLGGRPLGKKITINYSNILNLPISVGIFLRHEILIANKLFFDEKFGAGTNWGSGEESDILLSIFKLNSYSLKYNGHISVFHPVIDYKKEDIEKVEKYAKGMGALLAKHRRSSLKLYMYLFEMIFRGLFGCFLNILNFKFTIYWLRTKGLITGYIEGVRYYENNS